MYFSTEEVLFLKTAAIGIGSNSLRMLVAKVEDGKLHRIKRFREGLRTFAALDENGNIGPEMIRSACEKVGEFYQEALNMGAEKVHLFATSAIRDAANQAVLISALEEATGLEMDICSGKKEAALSYVGAADMGQCGMIDIGGGSTELAIGTDLHLEDSDSLQMGAVRLHRLYPITDGPSVWFVVEKCKEILQPVFERFTSQTPINWVGVGGTFTTCSTISQEIPHDDRQHVHGYVLTRQEVERLALMLADMPLEERFRMPSLQEQRADIVVHGIAILLACMDMLKIPQIKVSTHGNLEGYLKLVYLDK